MNGSPELSTSDNDSDTESETKGSSASLIVKEKPTSSSKQEPRFEISQHRKFEVSELCEIYYNKYLKYVYLVVLSLHNFLARWSFAAVAASAWAVNIPFSNFGDLKMCNEIAFLHNTLPSQHLGCLHAYYFSLTMFAVIVVTLSLFDIKQQAVIQVILGSLRFVVIFSMLLYAIVQFVKGEDACLESVTSEYPNLTMPFNVDMSSEVFKFNPKGLLLAVPVFTYGYLFHTGLSSLSHPIKPKKYLHWLVVTVFVGALVTYLLLGIILSLWFRASIQETSTLNWVRLV